MKSKKLVGYIDDQGEIHDNVVAVFVGHKIHSPYGYSWMQINQDFLKEFAARRDLGNEVLRVFLYLNARLDFENIIQVPQVEIATELGMQRQNVNRAIKQLEKLGIIIRGPKVGRSSSWRLNPQAGWKGKVVNLREQGNRAMRGVDRRLIAKVTGWGCFGGETRCCPNCSTPVRTLPTYPIRAARPGTSSINCMIF